MKQDSLLLIFLKTLVSTVIQYRGIDSDLVIAKMPMSEFLLLMETRDGQMSDAYIKAKKPVFGRIGLKHAEGIQNEILKNISSEEAKDRFIFFHIYSKELTNFEEWQYLEDIKDGKIKLPLDIVLIDATNLTEAAVTKMINIHIQEKELALLKYQKETLVEPEIKIAASSKDKEEIIPEHTKKEKQKPYTESPSSPTLFKRPTQTEEEKKPTLAVLWSKVKPFL